MCSRPLEISNSWLAVETWNSVRHFQSQISSLRPLIDEIQEPSDPPALVLKHLDDDLLNASAAQRLTGPEIKRVAKNVLEALEVLHDEGYVHTGMMLSQTTCTTLEALIKVKLQILSLITYW